MTTWIKKRVKPLTRLAVKLLNGLYQKHIYVHVYTCIFIYILD